MKERLLTLVFALAALLCFYALFFPTPGAQPQSLPVSTDAGADGYLGAWSWLQAEKIPTVSLRDRYQRLATAALSPMSSGNVLITTLPHRLPFQLAEWQQLQKWIADGNTLVIMAALDDTPPWALGGNYDALKTLERIGGMTFSTMNDKPSLKQALEPQSIEVVAQGAHPLLGAIYALQANSELPASHWQARSKDASMPLAIARRKEPAESVLWLKSQGQGQIIVSALATPFSNREIGGADNALLLSNIIAWSRSERGRVIFDDAHQGLVDFYDAAHFFADPRLHRTLWWILLLWLVFVLGSLRLRSAPQAWHGVDETALIEASGRFFSVAVDPADARRELFANFFDAVRRRLGMPENGEPVWEWLDERAPLTPEQRRELHSLYARVCAQHRVSLQHLHNQLAKLEGQFT